MNASEFLIVEYGKLSNEYDDRERDVFGGRIGGAGDRRTIFEKDRAKVIHSAAFRRLQGKTQVFGMGGSDFFRTRLTHSLEAAQIAKGIALNCGHANTELVEAASLAHDIGHPPFGHTGEAVLKDKMRCYGGFEGNAQNLRLLTKLESRTARLEAPGLHISRATLDGILKYKKSYSQIDKGEPQAKWKFYYDDDFDAVEFACYDKPQVAQESVTNQFLPTADSELKSYECEIMEWADDIAYSTHDLEDGLKAGMINASKISGKIEDNARDKIEADDLVWDPKTWDEIIKEIERVSRPYDSEKERKGDRKDLISSYINSFVNSTKADKRNQGHEFSRYEYTIVPDKQQELKCNMLKSIVWQLIINDERVATLQRKAEIIVRRLFDEFTMFGDKSRTKEMYPADFREKLAGVKGDEENEKRIACDYISGMTDAYASRMYSRLTEGEASSLFDVI
jgi:dGTPase